MLVGWFGGLERDVRVAGICAGKHSLEKVTFPHTHQALLWTFCDTKIIIFESLSRLLTRSPDPLAISWGAGAHVIE